MKKQLLSAFSLIDINVLLYKNPPFLTSDYYHEAFLLTKRMLLKYQCQYMICELQEVASDYPEAKAGIQEFLPQISSFVKCLIFVIPDKKKWKELKFVLEAAQVYLDCKVVAVRTQEQALNIFRDMESDN